jgi:hypothetical protein
MVNGASAQALPERAERYLLLPPVEATFGGVNVVIGDISTSGVRLRHGDEMAVGAKGMLRFRLPGAVTPVALESELVWTQPSLSADIRERHVSGVRLHATGETVERVVKRLHDLGRSHSVREQRGSDRFILHRPIPGDLEGVGEVRIIDLATKGVRIETRVRVEPGTAAVFSFPIPKSTFEVRSRAEAVWCRVSAIWGDDELRYRTGMRIVERPELVRLAVGQLSELKLAVKDTQSLKLKLKISKALEAGPAVGHETVQDTVPGSEYFPMVQAVRSFLASHDGERAAWKEIATQASRTADIRSVAGPIREHIEALSVWEYLERSIDPSIIALTFARHPQS